MQNRVGFGFDSHSFTVNKALIIGGVEIPYKYGLKGHSDADVLLHAITDALLGAAALRDIGFHFPDTDDAFKNKESSFFLSKAQNMLAEKGWAIANIDATVILQQPKLSSYIPMMIKYIAALLQVSESQISVKAKTAESMGYIGRGEGIAVHAIALIYSIQNSNSNLN